MKNRLATLVTPLATRKRQNSERTSFPTNTAAAPVEDRCERAVRSSCRSDSRLGDRLSRTSVAVPSRDPRNKGGSNRDISRSLCIRSFRSILTHDRIRYRLPVRVGQVDKTGLGSTCQTIRFAVGADYGRAFLAYDADLHGRSWTLRRICAKRVAFALKFVHRAHTF
jgi:hypothetical protein